MKFFHYTQNNSGGYYIINDDVAANVIIQAERAAWAHAKLNEITEAYSEYCECCGPRWSGEWVEDDDGTDAPTIWDNPIEAKHGSTIIYHADGTVERLHYPEKSNG